MTDQTDPGGALAFPDAAEWDSWLREHHHQRQAAWLKIARKGSDVRSITAAEGTEVALCYGWIDSHRKALDDTYFLQKYTPRRRGSAWSKINRQRAEELIAAGRMRDAGLAEIAAAKADGRWAAAYESQRHASIPPDLEAALAASPLAKRAFESLGRTDRYALMLGLLKARTSRERRARLDTVLAALETDDDGPRA
jgi:uncharacterized protein YdeI (YjbR/CyaY-like superfamily)